MNDAAKIKHIFQSTKQKREKMKNLYLISHVSQGLLCTLYHPLWSGFISKEDAVEEQI